MWRMAELVLALPGTRRIDKVTKEREEVIIGGEKLKCGYARLGLLRIGLLRTVMTRDGLSSLAKRHRRIDGICDTHCG